MNRTPLTPPTPPPASLTPPGTPQSRAAHFRPPDARPGKRRRATPPSEARTEAGSESPSSHSHPHSHPRRRAPTTKTLQQTFFEAHAHEEWFRERYHPDYVLARSKRIASEVRARARNFADLFDRADSWVYAPDLSYSTVVPEAFSSADDIWDDATYGEHMSRRTIGSAEEGVAHQPDADECLPSRRRYRRDTLFLRKLPPDVGREALTAVLRFGPRGMQELGFVRLKIGEMSAKVHHPRTAWVVYRDEKAALQACDVLQGVVVRATRRRGEEEAPGFMDYKICCQINEDRRKRVASPRLLPYVFGTAERMKHDVRGSVRVMRFLDRLRNVDAAQNPFTDKLLSGLESDARRLDHVLTYLVEVHSYCYYNGVEFLEDVARTRESTLRPRVNRFKHLTKEDVEAAARVDQRTAEISRRKYDQPKNGARHAEYETSRCVREWVKTHAVRTFDGSLHCQLVKGSRRTFKSFEELRDFMVFEFRESFREIVDGCMHDAFLKNFEFDIGHRDIILAYNAGIPR